MDSTKSHNFAFSVFKIVKQKLAGCKNNKDKPVTTKRGRCVSEADTIHSLVTILYLPSPRGSIKYGQLQVQLCC